MIQVLNKFYHNPNGRLASVNLMHTVLKVVKFSSHTFSTGSPLGSSTVMYLSSLARPEASNRGKTKKPIFIFFLKEKEHSVELIDRNTKYNFS